MGNLEENVQRLASAHAESAQQDAEFKATFEEAKKNSKARVSHDVSSSMTAHWLVVDGALDICHAQRRLGCLSTSRQLQRGQCLTCALCRRWRRRWNRTRAASSGTECRCRAFGAPLAAAPVRPAQAPRSHGDECWC
jgi:hypothetical protein